jgi:hypothetical protein
VRRLLERCDLGRVKPIELCRERFWSEVWGDDAALVLVDEPSHLWRGADRYGQSCLDELEELVR